MFISDGITSKLIIAFRLDVFPMILIEIVNFVHEVDWTFHLLIDVEFKQTSASSLTSLLSF